MVNKPFRTINEQIKILKSRNLTFIDEEVARNALKRYGYYEIINGYKDSFLDRDSNIDEEKFKNGTTFEHIYALYRFDKQLSKNMLATLEKFERNFKQVLAYVVSENISEEQSKYTAKSNFSSGKIHVKRNRKGEEFRVSDRDRLINNFNKIANSENNPYCHYREDHGNVPPWIMIKGLTFGQSIYWYRLSSKKIKNQVLAEMFNQNLNLLAPNQLNQLSQLFGDILALYLKYRNLSAHDGRIYNYRSDRYKLRQNSIIYRQNAINISYKDFNEGKYRSSVGIVAYTLELFENKNIAGDLIVSLVVNLEDYLKKTLKIKKVSVQYWK